MKSLRGLLYSAFAIASIVSLTPATASAQCVKCVANACRWGPYLNAFSDCEDFAPGLGCLVCGVCGETMTNLTPAGGVYSRIATQVVAMDGSTYIRACSGALISVRKSSTVAESESLQLAVIEV